MAWIFDRYVYNQRLQIGREEVIRPMPMGTDWQSIRLGIRFCINDSPRTTFVAGTYGFMWALGVCQGSTTSFLANTVTDWIGGGLIGSSAAPAGSLSAFNAGTPNVYSLGLARPNGLSKIGSTYTFGAETSVGTFAVGSGQGGAFNTQNMCGLFVNILKGATSYSITPYYINSIANAQTNLTNALFLASMETTGVPTANTAGNVATIPYTGAGLFDCLSFVYTREWPNMEIDGMAVTRFA